jgi:hypothetical protein
VGWPIGTPEKDEVCTQSDVAKSEGKIQSGVLRGRCGDNIKKKLKEMEYEEEDCVHMIYCRKQGNKI